eukprot:gene23879-biopygen2089
MDLKDRGHRRPGQAWAVVSLVYSCLSNTSRASRKVECIFLRHRCEVIKKLHLIPHEPWRDVDDLVTLRLGFGLPLHFLILLFPNTYKIQENVESEAEAYDSGGRVKPPELAHTSPPPPSVRPQLRSQYLPKKAVGCEGMGWSRKAEAEGSDGGGGRLGVSQFGWRSHSNLLTPSLPPPPPTRTDHTAYRGTQKPAPHTSTTVDPRTLKVETQSSLAKIVFLNFQCSATTLGRAKESQASLALSGSTK